MLCVTHEMGFARKAANKIVFMADGQILERGTPDEFFEHPQTERAGSSCRRFSRTDAVWAMHVLWVPLRRAESGSSCMAR